MDHPKRIRGIWPLPAVLGFRLSSRANLHDLPAVFGSTAQSLFFYPPRRNEIDPGRKYAEIVREEINSMPKEKTVQVAQMDWPWKAENHAGSIILVSDEQFTNLANRPDEAVEKPAPWYEKPVSLREYCRDLALSGGTKIHIAYDYFFGGSTRSLYPDTPTFLDNLRKIHDVAREFHLGIEPSVLSPLELGVGYRAKTGECGRWMQYGEGLRDPVTGRYSVMLWQHTQWVNNKGPTPVELASVRVFAFREQIVPNSIYFYVNPDEIIELPTPEVEEFPGTRPIHYGAPEAGTDETRRFQAHRIRVFGECSLPENPERTYR